MSKSPEPTVTVTVLGEMFAWSNGSFSGSDESLARRIRTIAEMGVDEVRVHAMGQPVTVGNDSPRAAAAAMMSLDPGRALIVSGSEHVFSEDEVAYIQSAAEASYEDSLEDGDIILSNEVQLRPDAE